MVSLDLMIVITAILGNFLLGLLAFFNNPKNDTNRLFSVFALIISVYLGVNFLSVHQPTPAMFLFLIRVVMSLAILINLFFYLLTQVFPNRKISLSQTRIFVITVLSLLLSLMAMTPLIFNGIDIKTNQPIPGPAIPLFLIHTIVFLGLGIFNLIKKERHSVGVEKTQYKLFLFGTGIMFSLIIFFNVILVIFFHISNFVNFLPLYTLVFVGVLSYAIIKHRFLDIRLVIARTISYFLLITLFGLAYSLLFAVISSIFISSSIENRTIGISTIIALIMAFSFQTVRKEIEHATDKFFYKDHYDSSKLLYDLTLVMASTLRFEDLSHQFLLTLMEQMRVTKGAIILTSEDKIFDVAHEGYEESPSYNENRVFFLIEQNKLLIFDELDESKAKSFMRDMDISISVDIATAGQQIGLFTLGSKLSGDIYTPEDVRIIEIIVPELAVAIKNALSYDEISRFNITLKDEVDEATANLREANIKLQDLDKLKDEFVSVASHELRTPMTAIKSYLWMALNKPGQELNKELKNEINIAYESTERLLKLVQDMLTISRIEGKRLLLQKEEFSLNELSQQVYDILKISAQEREIAFNFNIPDKPISINGDKEKIREVLQNIIGNALKFTPVKGKIDFFMSDEKQYADVCVTNSGSYISPSELPKLFQKFNRLNIEATTKEGASVGTGLGLYITKQIIEMHNGTIDVTSDEKVGTTFHIKLPKSQATSI